MYLTQVELIDFRNYEHGSLALAPGPNLLVGANGQGKTNIVEAIAYLATLTSHRVATDAPLIRLGCEQAVIRARVVAGLEDARVLTLEIEINPGRANRVRLNRVPQRRPRDLMGALRAVLFTPDDLAIVKGDPAERRGAVDDVVVQRWPRFAGVKADYDRVVRQRNALLKGVSSRGRLDAETSANLDIWGEQLAVLGAELMLARAQTIADMRPHLERAYEAIAPTNNAVEVTYRPNVAALTQCLSDEAGAVSTPIVPGEAGPASDEAGREQIEADDVWPSSEEVVAALRQALAERREDEVRRGVSLVGPHRDDIEMRIGPLPAKGYASHGESWSLALSWRLAGFELLRQEGSEPVLLLDDVFAELDPVRRERLASAIADAEQTVITAADEQDVPHALRGKRFEVVAGTVTTLKHTST